MVYDEAHGYSILLASGYPTPNTPETWTYDGTSWSQRTTPGAASIPFAFFACALTYDATSQRVVAFITGTLAGTATAVLLTWDGQDWSLLPTANISYSQISPTFCYDHARNQLVAYDGSTFVFDGVNWNGVQPFVSPIGTPFWMFDDIARQRVVLITTDGTSNYYWEWNGMNWAQSFPSYSPFYNAQLATAAYSPDSHKAIAIAVPVSPPLATHTWEIGNRSISDLALPSQPSLRSDALVAYDLARHRFVLHGGVSIPTGPSLSDTWELDLGSSATYSTFGQGCIGTHGVPALTSQGSVGPVMGSAFTLQVSNMPWTGPAFLFFGFSDQSYSGVNLPYNLGSYGAPNCTLLCSGDVLFGIPNILGVGIWSFTVPSLPGVEFFNQAIAVDPTANGLGLTLSNAGHGVIGS
jgi:hypothetical protein